MIQRFLLVVLTSVFLISCDSSKFPGYSEADSGLFFKHHKIGNEERKVELGMYVRATFVVSDMEDKTSCNIDTSFLMSYSRKGSYLEALSMLMEEDSSSFILSLYDNYGTFLTKCLGNEHKEFKFSVKINGVHPPEEFRLIQQYLDWFEDQEMNELKLLKTFLRNMQVDEEKHFVDGIYMIPVKQGRGRLPLNGDGIYLHYKGYFTDSTLFDDTHKMEVPFDFRLGDPDQVIEGIDKAIRWMNRGSRYIVIIPSQFAFGELGSSTGIVPPFTTVWYDLEMVRITSF